MNSRFGEVPATPLPHDWEAAPCLDLINSRWTDHLGGGRSYDRLQLGRFRRVFLKRWRFAVGDPDDPVAVRELAELRVTLRSTLERYVSGRRMSESSRQRLEQAINRVTTDWQIAGGGSSVILQAHRRGRDWDIVMAEIAISAVKLMSEREKVKICNNPNCSWMFIDESRPGTRRWCNPSVCGALVNVRRFRLGRGMAG